MAATYTASEEQQQIDQAYVTNRKKKENSN